MDSTRLAARRVALITLRMACDAISQNDDELALRLLLQEVTDLKSAGVAERAWEHFEATAVE